MCTAAVVSSSVSSLSPAVSMKPSDEGLSLLESEAQLHSHPDRCKINLVRCSAAHAHQIKLMEQISLLIKMKIRVSCNLAEH